MPTIPVPVWQQISIVIIFAMLLSGMGYVIVRIFVKAISDINAHYARLMNESNRQWQVYFDARSESSNLLSEKLTTRMDEIAHILGGLVADFKAHDIMERQALDEMGNKRHLAPKKNQNT